MRGTYNLLEVCRRHADLVERVVVASSDKALRRGGLAPVHGGLTRRGAASLRGLQGRRRPDRAVVPHTYGVPVAIARCGNVYGGGDLNWSRIVPGTVSRSCATSDPCCGATAATSATISTCATRRRPTSRLADAVGRDGVAGGAFNFSDERPLTVLELVGKIAERMETQTLEPIVLGSAVGEIREQVLSAEKARTVLGWRAARSRERPRRDDRLVQGPPRRRRSGAMTEHAEVQTAAELREQILGLVNEFHDLEFAPREFVPGETPVPVSGRVFDADELLHLVDASLDFWLTTGRYAKQFELQFARRRRPARDPVQLGLLGESPRRRRAHVQEARRAAAAAGRRGDHGRRGLPDDGEPDHLERARPRLRRRRARHVQPRRLAARGGARPAHARDHRGPHARQSVRPRRRLRVREGARPLADRGQLRRARLDLRRPADRLVRRLRDAQLLSGAPHHDGRGRRGADEPAAAEAAARVVPRLGSRLLVRARRGRHVRPPSRSSSAASRTATTTSTSTRTSATT